MTKLHFGVKYIICKHKTHTLKNNTSLDFIVEQIWWEILMITRGCFYPECFPFYHNDNNGPNGHLFYVGGGLMMRRGILPIIMLPDGDLRIVLHLVPFWMLTIWGSVHIEETVVGWRNQLRMKTSAT